jgi:hypothetical protein
VSRVETGPLRFGDDWPGTFIRGDDAFNYAAHLAVAVEQLRATHAISAAVLESLLNDLRASDVRNQAKVQVMRRVEDCRDPK